MINVGMCKHPLSHKTKNIDRFKLAAWNVVVEGKNVDRFKIAGDRFKVAAWNVVSKRKNIDRFKMAVAQGT